VFDKEFFATSLPVAIGHYTAGAPAASPQVRLLTADGTEYVVRRALAAAATWVSLEVIEDEDEPDTLSLLFVPYEHVRRVVFRPQADRPEQLGFRLHEPGHLDPDESPVAPGAPPAPGPAAATSPTSGQPPEVATAPPTPSQGPS
jgi:hypothetical protein